MPNRMFDFAEGVIPWHHRITAYALVLVNDRPPLVRRAHEPGRRPALSGFAAQRVRNDLLPLAAARSVTART